MKAKPKHVPDPRTWNEFQVACRLNRGVEWFRQHREKLRLEGFPERDELLGGWDSTAIELWYNRRSGIGLPTNDAEVQALRFIRGKRAS